MRVFDKKDLLIPLGAAAFGGSSIALSKFALTALDNPIVGVGLTLGTALFVITGYMIGTKRIKTLRLTRGEVTFPVLAGCSMAAAFFLNFSALQIGDVSIVAPVFSIFPLFGVFLSHLLLKEQITGRTWLGAAVIVAGIAVIVDLHRSRTVCGNE